MADAVAEPPPPTAPATARPRRAGAWTPAQALIMRQRSIEARRRKAAARLARLAEPPPQPLPPPATTAPGSAQPTELPLTALTAPAQEWRNRQLCSIRTQFERLVARMGATDDPAELARLSSALSNLEEMERRLADRQLPATVRAAPARRGSGMALME